MSLENRISELEAKIENLSKKHSALVDFIANTNSTTKPNTQTAQAPIIPAINAQPKQAHFSSAPATDKIDFFSNKLLPLASVFCFIFAAIFIVKLALNSGWLTPERQWGLVILLGFGLVGYSLFGPFIDDKKYRSYLAATGIVTLFIGALSSYLYFGLFGLDFSIVLVVMFSILSIYLSREMESDAFLVVASLGTYLAPVLFGTAKNLDFFTLYFSITSIAFSFIAVKLQSRVLAVVSSYFGIGAFAYLNQNISESSDVILVVAVETLQFLSFTFGTYYHSVVSKNPLTQKMAMAFLPVLLFFYATTYFFLDKLGSSIAPWISLGFAAFLFLLYFRAKKKIGHIESEGMIFGFITVVMAHSGYHQLLPYDAKPWLIPVFFIFNLVAQEKKTMPVFSDLIAKALAFIGAIEFFSLCSRLLSESTSMKQLIPAFASVALGFYYYSRNKKNLGNKEVIFLGLIHVLAILFLYRVAYDFGTLAVTAAWAAYSIAILALSYQFRLRLLAKSSLMILVLVGLKALVYDASQSATGLRILSLLLTGALLFASGLILKKINTIPES